MIRLLFLSKNFTAIRHILYDAKDSAFQSIYFIEFQGSAAYFISSFIL
jgi:hypothetical protein